MKNLGTLALALILDTVLLATPEVQIWFAVLYGIMSWLTCHRIVTWIWGD